MNLSDLESALESLDRERAQLRERSAELDRDRAEILAQIAGARRIAAKYIGGASAPNDTVHELAIKRPPVGVEPAFNGSVNELIHHYITRPDSPLHGLRHATRLNYSSLLKRIGETYGIVSIGDLEESHIQRMYDHWADNGQKFAMAHAMITMFRSLVVFGVTVLKDERCQRLSFILHRMKFSVPKTNNAQLSADQVKAIINEANESGLHSLALAQAIRFWCPLRQKDIIGEWVPAADPSESDIFHKNLKWIRGIRWERIDESFVLHHVTSWEEKLITVPLSRHPIVAAQIARTARRKSGPVIVSEATDLPWRAAEFRRQWRIIARKLGIPDQIKITDAERGDGVEELELGEQLPAEDFPEARDGASSATTH
jgi:hypothetical protein